MNEIRSVEISAIKAKNRIRQDLGDIHQLMESLRDHGLLNPVVITEDFILVAGQRRLEAARRLGWQAIQCRVISSGDDEQMLEIEIAENATRKDFSSDEMADALVRLDRLRNPGWFRRLLRWLGRRLRRFAARFKRKTER